MESKYGGDYKCKPNGRLRDKIAHEKDAQKLFRKTTRGNLLLAGRHLSPVDSPIRNNKPCTSEQAVRSPANKKGKYCTPRIVKKDVASTKTSTVTATANKKQLLAQKISERMERLLEFRRRKDAAKCKDKAKCKRKPFVTVVPVGRFLEPDDAKPSFAPCDHTFKRPHAFQIPKIVLERKVEKKTAPKVVIENKVEKKTGAVTRSRIAPSVKKPKVASTAKTAPKPSTSKEKKLKVVIPPVVTNTDLLFPDIFDKKMKSHRIFNSITSTAHKIHRARVHNINLIPDDEDLSPIENEEPRSAKKRKVSSAKIVTPANKHENMGLKNEDAFQTPPTNLNNSYLSPSVTVSRGKTSARKESLHRRSLYKVAANAQLESQKVIQYYRIQLEEQTTLLQQLCVKWNDCLDKNPSLPEEHKDSINCAVGQTKLLMYKRFASFGELIELCVDSVESYKGDGKAVLPADLEGLWTNIFQQVGMCLGRFKRLDDIKANNWVEKLPDSPPLPPRKAKVTAMRKTKEQNVRVSQRMRNIIAQARAERNARLEKENSPIIEIVEKKQRNSRLQTHELTPVGILKTPKSRASTKKVNFTTRSQNSSPGIVVKQESSDGRATRTRRLSLKDISNI